MPDPAPRATHADDGQLPFPLYEREHGVAPIWLASHAYSNAPEHSEAQSERTPRSSMAIHPSPGGRPTECWGPPTEYRHLRPCRSAHLRAGAFEAEIGSCVTSSSFRAATSD